MPILFTPDNHEYKSLDPEKKIKWTSVTTLISHFKPKFDAVAVSEKVSKNKKSKWYGIDPVKIREIWNRENKRSTDVGSYYHDQREVDITALGTIRREGVDLPIISPMTNTDGSKQASSQRLTEGIYPEHLIYLKSAAVCGQADRVEIIKNFIDIFDYKTNKKIETEGYTNWEGITKKLLGPLSHLDDCNFNHYALQLSTYAYMLNKHNPKYEVRNLSLYHVKFKKEGEDEWGFPIYEKGEDGKAIVEIVTPYKVPYLKDEVIAMINWFKDEKERGNL